jgi:hypothetical protein
MSAIRFANNATAEIANSITAASTSINLVAGQGVRFPSLSGGQYFYATLVSLTNELEIVRVTARSGDTLTVVRAQEGTTALSFVPGEKVELRPTAAVMQEMVQRSGDTMTGNLTAPTFIGSLTGNVSGSAGSVVNSLTAGNGLAGTAFNGSAAQTFALGTPSTLTTGTTNGVTATSHTHAVTFPVTSVNGATGAVTVETFPTGTEMMFVQTSAPTGWTKSTTHNNKALRVVNGTAGSGGTTAFTTVFANQTPTITTSGLSVSATTLTTSQIPSHAHSRLIYNDYGYSSVTPNRTTGMVNGGGGSANLFGNAEGGGASHSHGISGSATSSAITLNVQYVDVIIATKN